MKTQMFVELAISPCQLGGGEMGANELQITETLGSVEMDFSETVDFSVLGWSGWHFSLTLEDLC